MKNEPIKHDQNHPPAASARGENAYYLRGCETVQRSPSYASCLFKLAEVQAGRDNDYNRECGTAIRAGRCHAKGMREQELLQGVALYYFPRTPPQALHVAVKDAGDFGVRITNLTDPTLIPKDPPARGTRVISKPSKTKPTDPLDAELDAAAGGYAAAITAAVADLPEEPPVPASVAPPVKVTPPPAPAPKPVPAAPTHAGRPPMISGETPLQYARRIAAQRNAVPA